MKYTKLLFFFALSAILSCSRSPQLTEAQRATVTNEVQLMLRATSDSVRANGMLGWLSFFHNSPDFSWGVHKVEAPYDSIAALLKHISPQYRSVTATWDSIQVEPKTIDEASFAAKFNEIFIDNSGNQSSAIGSMNAKLLRVDGHWKFHKVETQ